MSLLKRPAPAARPVIILSIVCATVLEGVALATNHDGLMFSATMAFFGAALGSRMAFRKAP